MGRNSFDSSTPPVEAFVNKMWQWFLATIPGGVVYGPPHVGKSSAIEYVMRAKTSSNGSRPDMDD